MVTPVLGSIYLVSDIDMINNLKTNPNTKIISLTEEQDYMRLIPEAIPGTVFLPPYEALVFLTDSDMKSFYDIYMSYLIGTNEVSVYTAVILRAVLMEGINIILFVPKDELELNFFPVLADYFMRFGVITGTPVNNFAYNPAFDAIVCQLLYMFDYMSMEELMVNFPPSVAFDPNTIVKLCVDHGNIVPKDVLSDPTLLAQSSWFFSYKERIKQNNNNFLQRGITRI